MTDRTGWHCLACNRYFQTASDDPDPDVCPVCQTAGELRRIDHSHEPTVSYAVDDVVVCELLGFDLEYVIGVVTEIAPDRVQVDALDGSGTYSVKPEQIIGTRDRDAATSP